MSKDIRDDKPAWYVAHTYSGYENRVKVDIEQTIKNRNLEDFIFEIKVPTRVVTEIRAGKEIRTEKKLFPGYVLIKMILNDETWYIVRNTRGVTGFVGPDSKAVPVPIEEIERLAETEKEIVIQYEVGDSVLVTVGPFKDHIGKIIELNDKKRTVTLAINIMGGENLVKNVDFADVKKI